MNFIKKIFAISVLTTALTICAYASSVGVTYYEQNNCVVVSGIEKNVVAIEVILDVVSGDASNATINGYNSSANTFVIATATQVKIYSVDSVDIRTGDDEEIILGTLSNVSGVTFADTVYVEVCDFLNNEYSYGSVSAVFDDTSDAPGDSSSNNSGSSNSNSNSNNSSSNNDDSTTDDSLSDSDVSVGDFTDVSSHWANSAIAYVVENGLFNGVTTTQFQPDTNMSRAMFVTVLSRYDGVDTSKYTTNSFTDVADNQWYTNAVNWAVDAEITTGMTSTTFVPDGNITREQMAVLLYKYILSDGITIEQDTSVATFKDYTKISSYAKTAVVYMQQTGLISGRTDGTFDPQGLATRAEVATIMERFANLA